MKIGGFRVFVQEIRALGFEKNKKAEATIQATSAIPMKTHTFRVYANAVPNQINAGKVRERCKICRKRPFIKVFIKKLGEILIEIGTRFLYVFHNLPVKRYHIVKT